MKDKSSYDLQRALGQGDWYIFHFIGHGGFDEEAGEGKIALTGGDGKPEYVRATPLARLLGDHRPLRLAVLNTCQGATGSQDDLFSSTAAVLVRRGLPAVLAMQYAITDQAAIQLSRVFYEFFGDGQAVDTALGEARKALSLANQNSLEWVAPVLYLRAPDGLLFNLQAAENAAPLPEASRTPQTVSQPAPPPAQPAA